jgi:hypothetical protein
MSCLAPSSHTLDDSHDNSGGLPVSRSISIDDFVAGGTVQRNANLRST